MLNDDAKNFIVLLRKNADKKIQKSDPIVLVQEGDIEKLPKFRKKKSSVRMQIHLDQTTRLLATPHTTMEEWHPIDFDFVVPGTCRGSL
eukprot:scaffold15876_cov73-Cylindrotheca_fusiformis.AAC.1